MLSCKASNKNKLSHRVFSNLSHALGLPQKQLSNVQGNSNSRYQTYGLLIKKWRKGSKVFRGFFFSSSVVTRSGCVRFHLDFNVQQHLRAMSLTIRAGHHLLRYKLPHGVYAQSLISRFFFLPYDITIRGNSASAMVIYWCVHQQTRKPCCHSQSENSKSKYFTFPALRWEFAQHYLRF